MRLIDADVLLEPIVDCAIAVEDGDSIELMDCDKCPCNILDCEDFEKIINAAPTMEAVYICNRRKCDRCDPECDFTRDIDYAATTDKVIIVDGTRTVCLSCQTWNKRASDE